MSTCNELDLEALGPRPTQYAQKLPGHSSKAAHYVGSKSTHT